MVRLIDAFNAPILLLPVLYYISRLIGLKQTLAMIEWLHYIYSLFVVIVKSAHVINSIQ